MIQDNTFYRSAAGIGFQPECRFAPVVPISLARGMKQKGILGNYHLLLAHDVLDKPADYAAIYAGMNYTILMDNSLIELGYAMDIESVVVAARIVGAQYLVLPDTLSNSEATKEQVRVALDSWNRLPAASREGLGLIAVIQGADFHDQMNCLDFFTQFEEIVGVSVPRVVAQTCGTRRFLVNAAARYYNIHLLGFSDNFLDDIACARMPGVIGIDSAVPIRLALRGQLCSLDIDRDAGKRECYWEDPYALACSEPWTDNEKDQMIRMNLRYIRTRIGK